jgi:pimeloyl-ACP methyl ester carboxylesterase
LTPRHHTVDVRGLEIHWVEWGEAGDEPLILVHGFRDHCRSWDFFVNELRDIWPEAWVLAPDCRGHGDSGWVGVGGYYHFFDYLMDLDSLVRSLGVRSVKLVGHSMGGTMAALYAGTYPTRVSKLALVEGLGPPGLAFDDAPDRTLRWLEGVHRLEEAQIIEYASIDDGARRLQKTDPPLDEARATYLARHAMRPTGTGTWRWKFDPLHRTTSPQPFYLEQFAAFLARISCPTLVVQGSESGHRIRGDLAARSNLLKNTSLVTIPGAGHWVQQDNPTALAKVLTPFLT